MKHRLSPKHPLSLDFVSTVSSSHKMSKNLALGDCLVAVLCEQILSIRKVLFHELAHNEFSDHDDNFYMLMRQV